MAKINMDKGRCGCFLELLDELFYVLDSEFDRLGLLAKRGSFIDATIMQA